MSLLVLLLAGPALLAMSGSIPMGGTWQGADRSSAGLAAHPDLTPEAVVQVYGAMLPARRTACRRNHRPVNRSVR
ncbi:MAG TPA: hypothetical protein VLN90_07515 [Thioalkalivibrio sp.]|nr:hypothetical protein [Thioalkalivibrio sp.]